MKFSDNGINLLKSLEGCKLLPYDDQTSKIISDYCKGDTIGIGHLIRTPEEFELYSNGITAKQAIDILSLDILPTVDAVSKLIKKEVTQNQFDALIILVFNIGIGGFSTSSVLHFINKDKEVIGYGNIEAAWMAWNKSQGKVMDGLTNRRKAEYDLYCTPV